ncbi:MAG: hypothetical protein RR691_05270 [Eubacterium sp.]
MKNELISQRVEWICVIILLGISLFGIVGLLLFCLLLLIFLKQRRIGAIKMLALLAYRTILSPGVAAPINSIQILKYFMIIGLSFYLITNFNKLNHQRKRKLSIILALLTVFFLLNFGVNFFISSLPFVATLKLILYILPFVAVFVGIGASIDSFNWINWMTKLLCSIPVISLPFIVLSKGYLVNHVSFQGITNQPNMLGIILVLTTAFVISAYQQSIKKKSFQTIFLLILILIEIILSDSRTALIGYVVLIIYFFIFIDFPIMKKTIFILSMIIIITFIFLIKGDVIINFLVNYIAKGNMSNILYSREAQLEELKMNFLRSPIWGNGFSVPVLQEVTWKISFDYLIETGNLIMAVLSYSGVIGFLIFILMIFVIFTQNKRHKIKLLPLFMAPLLISMGEMVFFSTNNMAIWLYIMFALYCYG